jgi:ribosomal protein S18 acetylase RimI-like enzyme
MGRDPEHCIQPSEPAAEESGECSATLPYGHDPVPLDVARHFVARDRAALVGHVVLHVEGDSGGIYDMGVAPRARRQGHGTALTLAAVTAARELGCSSVTLNATGEGEPLYRSVGFTSLGYGMTWWLFPRRPAG